jgi:hypothetical protein
MALRMDRPTGMRTAEARRLSRTSTRDTTKANVKRLCGLVATLFTDESDEWHDQA